MKDTSNNKPLYLPPMVPDINDFISGIGPKEISVLAVGFGITIVGIVICYVISGNLVSAFLLPFLLFALLFICIRRDQYEESLVDKLMYVWKYQNAQKKFEYEYHDELGLFMEETMEEREKNNDRK